jgi:DNA-binding NtrC family response regulator
VIERSTEIAHLLVVSRDSAVLRPFWSIGESNRWQLETAASAWEAMDKVQSGMTLDLLLVDLPQGNEDGLQILRWLRRLRPALPIVLIGYPYDDDRKDESIRMGAREYLVRPIDNRQLEIAIRRNLSAGCEAPEINVTSEDVEPVSDMGFFIAASPIMRKLRSQAALLAEADVPVLILGEDGSGKETIARLIHRLSVRSGFEFAKVNCGVLPGDLLEKELFGYEKNGMAAPAQIRTGKLERCAKGTILLDQITELPLDLQSNLLGVLQNKRFTRPGASASIAADVRVIAASCTNVEQAISEDRLREDLYHQLSAYTIHVPPLRERREEISLLSRHFMHWITKHYGLSPREFSPAVCEAWQAYSWPGNLRELEHRVKRYLLVGDEDLAFGKGRSSSEGWIGEPDLTKARNANLAMTFSGQSSAGVTGFKSLRSVVQRVKSEAERNVIAAALERTSWNRRAAARLLQVSYRTVLYKIEQYKMTASRTSVLLGGDKTRKMTAVLHDNGFTIQPEKPLCCKHRDE